MEQPERHFRRLAVANAAMVFATIACSEPTAHGSRPGTGTTGASEATRGAPADPARLRASLAEQCSGTVAIYDVCAQLAVMAARGEGGPIDLRLAANAAGSGCTREGADRPLREVRAEACRILGEAARKGEHYLRSDEIADRAFADACALGLADACAAVRSWALALSPNGEWIAGIDPSNKRPRVWSTTDGKLTYLHDREDRFDQLVWSPTSTELRLVGALDWSRDPPHAPSFEVRVNEWSPRRAKLHLPLVYGWLADGRLVWRDPEGTALKTSTESGAHKTIWSAPTSTVACDHDGCVAPTERGGVDRSLVMASGGSTREAPRFYSWIVGSRVAQIDCHEAFDLRTWQRISLPRELRDACPNIGGFFVGDGDAWAARGDELIALDRQTYVPEASGIRIPGLARCKPEQSNSARCAWDRERKRLFIQHGGNLRAVDLPSGRTTLEVPIR